MYIDQLQKVKYEKVLTSLLCPVWRIADGVFPNFYAAEHCVSILVNKGWERLMHEWIFLS